ncbi:MAG: SDR family NAD(P)-dependent oxidoreductase [Lachnospiraceae bacterium]|nr:SDR family NAD(P)-dependent oxidoreductase [Lachnospiraceae bacterium]
MSKNVVVTGGAGGLGMQIVKQHLAKGDYVWAFDLNRNPYMEELEASELGKNLKFFPCDISSTEAVQKAVGAAKETLKGVDSIYSCAGVIRAKDRVPLGETDLDAIPLIVNINAVGFLRVIKELLPEIKNTTAIVCVTSEAGSITNNHRSQEYSYGMSKCAENMACVILQRYFDESIPGARVVCLHPGWLKTKMGGGDVAEVEPADSAAALIKINEEIDQISREHMFIDYQRNIMPW